MIYGLYSTGWRDETERRNARRRAMWVRVGVAATLAAAAAAYGGVLWLAGVI